MYQQGIMRLINDLHLINDMHLTTTGVHSWSESTYFYPMYTSAARGRV